MERWDVAHVQVVLPKASVGTDTWIQAVNMDSTVGPMGAPGCLPWNRSLSQHCPALSCQNAFFALISAML